MRPDPGAAAPRGCAGRARRTEFAEVVKSGRTHLMDATPVTLGQEFGGYAAADPLRRRTGCRRRAAARRAAAGRHRCRHRHQRPAGFAADVIMRAGRRDRPAARPRPATTSRPRAPATLSSSSPASCAPSRSASTRSPTTSAGWARDRAAGLSEICLPDLQPGRSIMPGKVNPVSAEAADDGRAPRSSATTPRSRAAAPPATSSST